MSGQRWQRMSGLPVEHARAPGGGALCGARRRQGLLFSSDGAPTCRKCIAASAPTVYASTGGYGSRWWRCVGCGQKLFGGVTVTAPCTMCKGTKFELHPNAGPGAKLRALNDERGEP